MCEATAKALAYSAIALNLLTILMVVALFAIPLVVIKFMEDGQ